LYIDNLTVGPFIRNTLIADKLDSPEEAILEIYKRLRPGDPPTLETAYSLFNNLFFNPERYDLSTVGRLKLNHKFRLATQLEDAVLTKRDIIEVVRYLVALRDGRSELTVTGNDGAKAVIPVRIDDIDHLGNRRVRAVGELMENQYRIGLVRMERAVKERMSMSQEIETLMPHDNQRKASICCGQRILWFKPAFAVYGPDESAQ
jgi:DNA-directed RNA polymerase subunit beta